MIYILVGGFNHLEKYESQWEGLCPYMKWKIKNVWNHHFVTTLSNASPERSLATRFSGVQPTLKKSKPFHEDLRDWTYQCETSFHQSGQEAQGLMLPQFAEAQQTSKWKTSMVLPSQPTAWVDTRSSAKTCKRRLHKLWGSGLPWNNLMWAGKPKCTHFLV